MASRRAGMHTHLQKEFGQMARRQDYWLSTIPEDRQRELLAKHEAFWRREPGSDALLGYVTLSSRFPLQNLDIQHEGVFAPHDVTAQVMLADTRYRSPILPEDELFPAKTPLKPVA